MGNAPGYDTPEAGNWKLYTYPSGSGGKYVVYDGPGKYCKPGWDVSEDWALRAWALGTDGTRKEDRWRISMKRVRCA